MQILTYRDGKRSIMHPSTGLRVRALTPRLYADERSVRQIIFDTRGSLEINVGRYTDDDTLYLTGMDPQDVKGSCVQESQHARVDARCFLGVHSDIPSISTTTQARRLARAHTGAHQMTLILFLSVPITNRLCRSLVCALNWAVSDSLGIQYCEWFVAPDTDALSYTAGLVIATPETSKRAPSDEIQNICIRATQHAMATALTRYFIRIS